MKNVLSLQMCVAHFVGVLSLLTVVAMPCFADIPRSIGLSNATGDYISGGSTISISGQMQVWPGDQVSVVKVVLPYQGGGNGTVLNYPSGYSPTIGAEFPNPDEVGVLRNYATQGRTTSYGYGDTVTVGAYAVGQSSGGAAWSVYAGSGSYMSVEIN
jgi:hypothetical protein